MIDKYRPEIIDFTEEEINTLFYVTTFAEQYEIQERSFWANQEKINNQMTGQALAWFSILKSK